MTAAFFFDHTNQPQAQSPANAVQCLRGNAAYDSIANLWGRGGSVTLVWQTPPAGSGALLMMGRTDELTNALIEAAAPADNAIQYIACSDDYLVAYYVRCRIEGTSWGGLGGHTYTVVSVAPLSKYWGLQRGVMNAYQGYGGWYSMYPWSAQDPELYNSYISLDAIRHRVTQLDGVAAFPGLTFR
jgi:hypothetical protein